MKRELLLSAVAALALGACGNDDDAAEEAGEDVDDVVEEATGEDVNAAEEVGEAVDEARDDDDDEDE